MAQDRTVPCVVARRVKKKKKNLLLPGLLIENDE